MWTAEYSSGTREVKGIVVGWLTCLGALVPKFVRQFSNGGRLASPIHAHYEEHCWLSV